MASIKVAVRSRPLSKRERDLNCQMIIETFDKTVGITNVKLPAGINDTLGRERVKNFTYDFAYWSTDLSSSYVSQEKVYKDLGSEVVESAYEGYNACVVAYGQTGSGKTYTMMGEEDPEHAGLIPRICENLFAQMQNEQVTYRTEVSYLEIYNERVRDLLREDNARQRNLKVREHPKDGPYVQDLSKHLVLSYPDIAELIAHGNANRTTAATNMNDVSSRSHAIFTITFTQATFRDDLPSEMHSKINLVDLAGSERADAAGTSGERLKEGGSINKSLVTLGNVISTLADMADRFRPGPRAHMFIPYRDSVLTWLLKDSLGGNAKTIMIATVSPAESCYAETLSTLRYANRAKRIVNKPTINEDPNVRLIRELREENTRLKGLLGSSVDLLSTVETRERLTQNEERMRQLTEKWTDKWQETANILEEHETLGLRREGTGVVLDSELPYLLAIDDNVLSTGMRLYHIKEGDTLVGRDDAGLRQDIVLIGAYIEAEHCVFRHRQGEVYLIPKEGARCSINSNRVHQATKLNQGALIRLGKSHIFRFNHPGEAAKLREEMKMNGPTQLVQVQRDFQWTWSTLSMNDSALGSDFDIESERNLAVDELDRLEEKKKELEAAEQEHVLAEACRLSHVAEQNALQQQLQQQQEQSKLRKQQTEQAQAEIERLSERFANQVAIQLAHSESIEQEEQRLEADRLKVQAEKQRIRQKRAKLRARREAERVREQLEAGRQQAEWEELELERRRVDGRREEVQQQLVRQKEEVEHHRNVEQQIYHDSMSSVRQLVEREMTDMHNLLMTTTDGTSLTGSEQSLATGGGESLAPIVEEDAEDLFEVESLRLRISGEPAIPLQYLMGSTEDISETEIASGLELGDKPVSKWSDSEIHTHVAALWEQVSDVRSKVSDALHAKYTSILSSDDCTHTLPDEVLSSFSNIRPLFDKLQQLTQLKSDDRALLERLREYDRTLTTIDTFLQIHSVVQAIEMSIAKRAYTRSLEHLQSLQKMMSSLDIDSEQECEKQLKQLFDTEACIIREKLLFALSVTWNDMLKWTLPSATRVNKARTVTLEVTDVERHKEVLTCTVQAMHDVQMLESRLKTLCDRLVSYFIEPVVTDRNTLLQVIEETEKYICVVLNPVPYAAAKHAVAVPPVEVFMKLEQIFLFLHKPLHNIIIRQKSDDTFIGITLVEKIGSMICKKLFECIYNQCLCHSIPRSSRNFNKFNEIVRLTENFQDLLTRLHFLSSEYSTLMDYVNNVNSLFANIKAQEMLRKAQEFMTQELMMSVEISSEHPLGMSSKGGKLHPQEKFVHDCKERAGTSNYKLPTCQISVPMRSLMTMAYDTLHEAIDTTPDGALHMANSVHNMFEMYCDVVPSFHKEKLTNLPLLAALHHNNCMFVAHHLITVDKTFRSKLASNAGIVPAEAPNMADLVPKVRKLGNEAFTKHMTMKKDRLTEYLQDTHGFECIADDSGSGAKTAVRHMLHHLLHISSIWKDILPINVYYRAVGSLLNAAITDIIESVLGIEEFSADDCDYLQDVLSHIVDASTEYFQSDDPKFNAQVVLHESVPNWLKFRELVSLLSSGLQDVSDRWADGKGPLGLVFTCEELRRIVLAMFENTSRRSQLLKQLRRPSVSVLSEACVFSSL